MSRGYLNEYRGCIDTDSVSLHLSDLTWPLQRPAEVPLSTDVSGSPKVSSRPSCPEEPGEHILESVRDQELP